MERVLKAVVKDHRVPADYNYCYAQPMHTKTFLKNVKRFFITRQLTKQNITIPLYMLFVSLSNQLTFNSVLPACVLNCSHHLQLFGYW